MGEMKNSTIMSNILKTVYAVASRRASAKFADETVGSSIRALENKYEFLKFVKVTHKDFTGAGFGINVNPDIDKIHPSRIAKAIESIIRVVYNDMNEEAGLYFISELKQIAGDEITRKIIDLEVDLDQIQIEQHHSYRRRERKKQIKKAAQSGNVSRLQSENLLGYTWKNVSKWKHEPNSKYCTLYDGEGKVLDRLNLDRIIENYVEKLSSFSEADPEEIDKQTRIYEKEYNLLKLLLERDMDADTAMHMLNVSKEDLNSMIKKLASMEMLHYVDYDTIELTKDGISFLSTKEKERKSKGELENIEVS